MARCRVVIDKDLQDFVPQYLEAKLGDLPRLFSLLSTGDLATLAKEGHKLAGTGGGYGFDRITELGRQLEAMALAGDRAGTQARLEELKDYLADIEIVYE